MKLGVSNTRTLTRAITFDILEGAQEFSTVGLLGSRQSGKTTLSRLVFKEHAYVSLKDIETRSAATIDPRAFLNANRNAAGLIIDEFHYVPELLSYLQPQGGGERAPGTYVVCGQHNAQTRELLSGYLTNTFSLYSLGSLSLRELSANYLLPYSLKELLYTGLHPGLYGGEYEPHSLYRAFISSYIDQDISSFGQVDSVTTFHTFMTQCALHSGQILNLTTLAHASGISDHTARRWLALLEDHQVVFLVQPYHDALGKRLIKSPKLYFYDPGLVCALLKISFGDKVDQSLTDILFKTAIMSELKKWSLEPYSTFKLYFWKDKTDYSIDCILEGSSTVPVLIESGHKKISYAQSIRYWQKISNQQEQGIRVVQSLRAVSEAQEYSDVSWRYLQPLYTLMQS